MDQNEKILESINALNKRLDKLTEMIKLNEYKHNLLYWHSLNRGGEDSVEIKKRFFRSLDYENEDQKTVQDAILLLAKEFHRICEKYDIDYWIDGGTVLGAMRHEGFIPWDDDLDVDMLRKDIAKLSEAIKKEDTFIELRDFICIGRAVYNIVRIMYKDRDVKVFIDIFPHDLCDADSVESMWSTQLKYRDEYVHATYKYKPVVRTDPGLDIWEQRMVLNPRDDQIVRDTLAELNEKMGVKEKEGKYVVWGIDNAGGGTMHGRITAYSDIFPLQLMKFEDTQLKGPHMPMNRCRDMYGDPFALPDDIMKGKGHLKVDGKLVNDCRRMLETYGRNTGV